MENTRYSSASLITTAAFGSAEQQQLSGLSFAFEARSDCPVLSSILISAIRPAYAKSVRASSITAIAIITNAVETNRILGSPPSWCG